MSEASVFYGVVCVEAYTLLDGDLYPLDDRRLAVTDTASGTTFEFDGSFDSETTAVGTVRISRSAEGPYGQCVADATLEWTAAPADDPDDR